MAPLVEWDSARTDGLQLWVNGSLDLAVNIKDTSGNAHKFNTAAEVLSTSELRHVAFTYDRGSGAAVIYVNGNVVAATNIGNVIPQTTYSLNIGRRLGQPIGNGDTYGGLMDELSLYNRALSASEIQADYAAGGGN